MSDTKLDQTEEAIIACEVSDDALETAAGTGSKMRAASRFSSALP